MAITENLDTFLADFGVTVVSGTVSGTGILDSPEQLIGGGIAISAEYSLLVKTSVFSSLNYSDAITVDGVAYTVREIRMIDDGKLSRVILSKT